MNITQLQTARWEVIHKDSNVSPESKRVLIDALTHLIGYPPPNIGDVPIIGSPIAPLPDLSDDTKIAICIGHARSNDSGAVAVNGVSEEEYNNQIALVTKNRFDDLQINSEIINYYRGNSYYSAMTWLANKLKAEKFTFAMELHFNSASPLARGHEYLFWHKSVRGRAYAEVFQAMHGQVFPGSYDRGTEPLGDEAHERGVLFTSMTHCPAIILEPFFGSNHDEVARYMREEDGVKLGTFYADATVAAEKKLLLAA